MSQSRTFFKALEAGGILLRDLAVECFYSLKLLWSFSRPLFAAAAVTLVLTSLMPFGLSIFFGRKLDSLNAGANTVTLSLLILGAWALLQIAEQVEAQIARQVEEFFREFYVSRLLRLRIALGFRIFEKNKDDGGLHEEMQLADSGEYWGPRLLQYMIYMLSGSIRSLVGLTFLVSTWPYETAGPLLVLLPLVLIRLKFAVNLAWTERELANNQGRITHFRGKFNKEKDFTALLLLGVAFKLARHVGSLLRQRKATINAVHFRTMFAEIGVTCALAVVLYFVFRHMEASVAAKAVTIGKFSLFWTSLLAAIEGLDRTISNLGDIAARVDQLGAPRRVEQKYQHLLVEESGPPLEEQVQEVNAQLNDSGLSIQDLSWGWNSRHLLFDHGSVEIPPGLTMVVGTNGAGKTSLCNLLTGIKEPPAEAIRLGGVDISQIPVQPLRRVILHAPQFFTDWTGMTFRTPFSFINEEAAAKDELVYQALDWAGVGGTVRDTEFGLDTDTSVWGNTKATFKFSGGYNVRFNLALIRFAMLAGGTKFVLFDEPFANLDGPTIEELLKRLRALVSEGLSVLLVLHHANLIADDDRVLFVHRKVNDGKAFGTARLSVGTHEQLKLTDSAYNAFVQRKREDELAPA